MGVARSRRGTDGQSGAIDRAVADRRTDRRGRAIAAERRKSGRAGVRSELSAAHRGALVAEGRTIAVIASGIDTPYPSGNSRLFDEICENGAIISEVASGVPALPHRFLTRNRIIAALSQSTLVVEAAFRSGSLRTARDAAQLLRPVMAIPGPINSPSSEGCHRLIGERAAELVTSVADACELISAL